MVVMNLVRHMDVKTFAPTVVCLGSPGEFAAELEAEGIPVVALSIEGKRLPVRLAKLSRVLREIRPHILHTHNPAPHLNGALVRRIANVPVLVHTKHGTNFPDDKWLVFKNWCASQCSNCVVPVSRDAAKVVRSVERVPEQLIRVIYNGIDTDIFQPQPNSRKFSFRAIHVARLHPIKDQLTLLRAIRLVVNEIPQFQLDIVGDGPAFAETKTLRDQLDLQHSVHMCGMQADISTRLQNADMFLLSSISEGISLTLLEAMSAGLPTVATDVGGNREVVRDEITGLLVPSGNHDAFAKAILRLCRNPSLGQRMGRMGRKRIVGSFSVHAMIQEYETLYKDLLWKRGFRWNDPSASQHRDLASVSD